MAIVIKEQLAASGNYGGSRTAAKIKYLVIHYTGNDGDKAANNAAYYQSNVVEASAHYFVDDTTVFRSVPDLKVAWAVGGKKYDSCDRTGGGTMHGIITNTNSISVELCDTVRDGTYRASEATLANAVALCVELISLWRMSTGTLMSRESCAPVTWWTQRSGLSSKQDCRREQPTTSPQPMRKMQYLGQLQTAS